MFNFEHSQITQIEFDKLAKQLKIFNCLCNIKIRHWKN